MDDRIRQIHETTIAILEKTGVRFFRPEILDILKHNGVKVLAQTAYFTEAQIMRWISYAPAKFQLFARNPKYDMPIGGNHVEFGPGYGATKIVNPDGTARRGSVDDYISFLKLIQQSDYFNINGGILVQPADVNPSDSFPVMLYLALAHSDKCLMGGPGGTRETMMVLDMLERVFGDPAALRQKPRIMTIINSVSPLQYDQETLERLILYARYGQPVIISPTVMAGTTGPITLAGTIALANAEALAGVAVAQMVREGTPAIFGFQAMASDMKTGAIASGSPESALCVKYGSRLAKSYGLPCRGGGAYTEAKCVSAQSGYESMIVMLTACSEGMNYIVHSAGILDSFNAMSYEKFIVDLEVIGMVNRFAADVRIDKDTLAEDVIREVGPGGEFLSTGHTLEHCRTELWSPGVSLRGALGGDFCQTQLFAIAQKKQQMIECYRKPELAGDILKGLRGYLQDNGISVNMSPTEDETT